MKPIKIEVKDLEIDLQNHTVSEKLIPGPKGEDGKDGETPTEEQLLALILPNIPKPKDGKDGKSITKTEVKEIIKSVLPEDKLIEKIVKKIPVPKDGEDGKSFRFADLTAYEKQILTGPPGSTGVGVPRGGTANQVLSKRSSRDFDTEWVTGGGGSGTVETVTGLNTDNADPTNPIVKISVDGVTVTGLGTPASPLVAVGDGTGDVHGPASSTDNAIARYDLTTGKIIQNSGITIADGATGTLSGTNTGDQTSIVGITGTLSEFNTALTGADFATGGGTVTGASSGTNTGDQTITNTSDATSHTVTLSASGGSVQLIEGANITLTTGGTGSAGTVTIASTASGSGDVTGPGSSTDNAVARFDGTTGKIIQNSAVTIADTTGDITAGKYNTVAISGSSTPTLAVAGTTTVSGNNTGDQTTVSGNAGTATTLQNSRTIGTATGDVTSAGSSFNGSANNTNAYTIANSAVTLAKMADLAQDQFIGRTTASTGVPQTATITAAARTVLDDTTVAAMVDTLGGATSTGTGGLVRAGSPALTTPSIAAITVSGGILTLPTGASDTLVSKNSTDTLTNKSISGGQITSAVATATTATGTNALYSATTTVNVSSATAPTSGQVLTATSSTAATWQAPAGGGNPGWDFISYNTASAASSITVSGLNLNTDGGMYQVIVKAEGSTACDYNMQFNAETGGYAWGITRNSFNGSTWTMNSSANNTGTDTGVFLAGSAADVKSLSSVIYLSEVLKFDGTNTQIVADYTAIGTGTAGSNDAFEKNVGTGITTNIEANITSIKFLASAGTQNWKVWVFKAAVS